MRRLVVVGLLLALVAPAPASAQTETVVDQAVAAFRKGAVVFVHPEAERRISDAQATALTRRIQRGARAVFVAVLPARTMQEAGGTADDLTRVLYRRLGYAGTYAVVAGDSFRAASTDFRSGRAAAMATDAFRDHRSQGVGAVLLDFVDRVERGPKKRSAWPLVGAFVIGFLIAAAIWFLVRRGRQEDVAQGQARSLEAARQAARNDLAVLAGELLALEPAMAEQPEDRGWYDAVVADYWAASEAIDGATTAEGVAAAAGIVAEARATLQKNQPVR